VPLQLGRGFEMCCAGAILELRTLHTHALPRRSIQSYFPLSCCTQPHMQQHRARMPAAAALAAVLLLSAAPAAVLGAAILDAAPTTDEVLTTTQSGCPCKEDWSYGAFITGVKGCSNPDSDAKVSRPQRAAAGVHRTRCWAGRRAARRDLVLAAGVAFWTM
jgi:hypothetical protein